MKNLMIDEDFPAVDGIGLFELKNPINSEFNSTEITVYPQREELNLEQELTIKTSTKIRLALEELYCFEVIENQFQHWGITFKNAIALQPSNPAFVIKPTTTVIMGAPKGGHLEINFKYPVQKVCGMVTSSSATVLSAYDIEGKKVAETGMSVSHHMSSDALNFPNAQLKLSGCNLKKVTFGTFDGQLILHHFRVEF
ncbi:conserved hypothetical protein [Planktothrix sp. PCC 11201]|uniref:hypothetical protein n=1 Tax=Planktothrix sp. PCC 11201 TaxID=1729650 RepID=UPI00090EBCCD|nr:hypothetical protein [Planktothrix sp. PCC 11201]SKB13241.1 conserved hypothetical protein [Planktothrix sp. PCC 11201]